MYNILIFLLKKCECKSYSHFFSKKFQHICVSLDVNFNESLTHGAVSFEQLGPDNLKDIDWTGRFILTPDKGLFSAKNADIFLISPQKHTL